MDAQGGLFGEEAAPVGGADAPLAARMRPTTFDEIAGQLHLVAPDAGFRRAAENGRLGSVILWGPPGVGKTTLAEIVARTSGAAFERVSAVSAGVADLRKVIENARRRRPKSTILFIDEIHRFNKSQQDAILPVVENGTVRLIGATTENPSFEVNSALLSRSRVYVLKSLSEGDIERVLDRALQDPERGIEIEDAQIEPEAKALIVNLSNGDARSALNMLELCFAVALPETRVRLEHVQSAVQRRTTLYDKSGEMHFDLISALHKSVRDSDIDASLYWLARMLDGGEDPLYLARRIVRMSVEDIGLADPNALTLTMAAQQAVHFMGMPEGGLALAEAVVFLAAAPKSNSVYTAFSAANHDVASTRNDPVPLHLRNAPTGLMKELGYSEGYLYSHDFEGAIVEQTHLPDSLQGRSYYHPTDRGYEDRIRHRLEEWSQRLRDRRKNIE